MLPRFPGRQRRSLFQALFLPVLGMALFAVPVQAQVVITEIIQNPSAVGDDMGEWFELHNPGGVAVDIDGWTVSDNDADSFVINNGGPLLVPAGGYLVLGNNADSGSNGGVTVAYQYSGMFLGNSADELVLTDGAAAEVDRVEWDNGATFPDPNGASMALVDPALDNNIGANWCTSQNPWAVGADDGTPGAANDCGQVIATLVINEIMQNPSAVSDSSGEWLEIHNPMGVDVDIDGFTISDNGSDSHIINNGGPLVIPAGGYLVLGNNADSVTNGGVPVAYQYSSWFLSNGDDEVVLTDASANEIDRVEYDGGPGFPDPNGASMALIDPGLDNILGESWCSSPNDFGGAGDAGSPGANNDCPIPESGDLVINEVDYDQPGTDRGEFIELYNAGSETLGLAGYSVVLINGSGGGASTYKIIGLPSQDLAAGDYFVICGDAAEVFGCDLDVSPNSNLVQNGSPDAVALTLSGLVVDTLSYEGDVPGYTEGSGAGLFDSSSTDFVGLSRINDGVDTDQNNVDFALRCVTPGTANTADVSDCADPRPPALRINEIDYDQPGLDVAEFVEIINAGNGPADLEGVDLVLINGSSGAPYRTISLPAVSLAPSELFVVCGNAANTPNCDLDVSPSSNLVQNGDPDGAALVAGELILDTVSYEGDLPAPYTEGSGVGLEDSGSSGQDFRGISRIPNGQDTNQNNVDFANACITPGLPNSAAAANCSANGPLAEIFDIQGSGFTSPWSGQGVATEANTVTAVGPEGFFMQTPDARDDANPDTSNGIYVFTGAAPAVTVGDTVNVSGGVVEFFDFTEISSASVSVVDSGQPMPAVLTLDAATPSPDPMSPSCAIEFECYEGMLVSVAEGTVTGPNQRFNSDPLAEVHITAAPARTYREPGIEFPAPVGLPEWDGNPEVFELDPDKLGLPNLEIPAGSGFSATGVIGFEFGGYELWPTALAVDPAPLPVPVRATEAAEMTVGALNLFRLYDDVDDAPIDVIDPDTNAVIRSTDDTVVDTAEYELRLGKFSTYIRMVMGAPDVLAVSEVESLAVLQDLAAVIAADDGSIIYSAWLEEGNDIGGIDVGFLVRDTVTVDAVTQLGRFEILGFDGSLLNDRPPLLLEARQVADGSDFPFAVMALHGRSLSGIDNAGSGGERVRQKRYEQARFVAQAVQALQEDNPDINLVVTGDFNSFEFTDGYVDVTGQMAGDFTPGDNLVCSSNACDDLVEPNLVNAVTLIPVGERYSFIFRGNAQTLDHALTTSGLDELLRDFQFARGNADAAVDRINGAGALRSSDHDGLVLFLAKDSDGDGVTDDADACAGTAIPESAPSVRLGVNRWALADDDRQFDSTPPKGKGPGLSFDIFDTAGCSCEQIVAAEGLGKGHLKFGCSNEVMTDWVEGQAQP